MATPANSKKLVLASILSGFGFAGAAFLTLVLVAVLYFLEVLREEKRLAPPAGIHELAAFSDAVSAPSRLKLVEHRGKEYIVWYGELAGPFDVPSGPSCYLFDGTGTLVGWQPETGEGGRIDVFLESATKGREITVEEARKIVRHSSAADGLEPREGQP